MAGEQASLVDARNAFERLVMQTNFRITPQLRHSFLELSGLPLKGELLDQPANEVHPPGSISKN